MRTSPIHGVSGSRRPLGPDAVYVLIAAVAIAMAIWVYLLARPPLALLPVTWNAQAGVRFGPLAGVLPEFLHVFAFILLTAAVALGPPRVIPICGFWLGIETLFELGQHPALAPVLASALPAWFERVPILDHTASYFRNGTFDAWDLVAITVGTLTAYAVIKRTELWR